MAKRGRRGSLVDHIVVLLFGALLAYVGAVPRYGVLPVALLGIAVIAFWVLFLMPTRCDFEVKGRGCRRRVNGKARGCHDHTRDKRDAIFAAFRMRNPGIAFRMLWRDSSATEGHALGGAAPPSPSGVPDSSANLSQARFNTVSLIIAAIGSIAGVLALFFGPA
jgi:hypothetical protein